MKKKATSFEIAYMAGVSQSTVSRALRNSPLVNEETRRKVQKIAKELNYTVDKHASNLRTRQSQTLALLLFEDPTTDDSHINPFFLSMLGSITRASANRGYDLLVSFQEMNQDWHANYEHANKADGIILLGYGDFQDYEDKLKQLLEQDTHFVRWGAEVQNLPVISIGSNNWQGGYDITQHLMGLNRKNVAFLGGVSEQWPEFQARYLGHQQALKDNNIAQNAALQCDAITTEQSGYEAMTTLLNSGQAIDAVFGASDLISVGAIKAIQEHGLLIPDDIALVGFDDIPMASFTVPALTTMQQDTMAAGEILVNSLIQSIQNESPCSQTIPAKLIVRKSCGS